jgi:glutamate---cysteine ligase / carboxylate-amine ligase
MAILHLFEGYGIELEYMIVDDHTLEVLPVTDKLLEAFAGYITDTVENGNIAWSNELCLHVVELKTNGPVKSLENISNDFLSNIQQVNSLLKPLGGKLLPTAMHPFMDPYKEAKLWPHEKNEIYELYNQIFDCRGHGWSNLQSTHLNLPFANDEEFGRLHAAIRMILPILPGLAASSPIKDGKYTGLKDTRLEVYRTNQKNIPSITGKVIPEAVFTKKDYQNLILKKNYQDISPFDPEGILQQEWLNSRGAIARFERNAIEIRILDIQECPSADLAIVKAIVGTIKNLVEEKYINYQEQQKWSTNDLLHIYQQCVQNGEDGHILNTSYVKAFNFPFFSATASELWQHLISDIPTLNSHDKQILKVITEQGTLATRIYKCIGPYSHLEKIKEVYQQLADCLINNQILRYK